MADEGGGRGERSLPPRSRLADYADMAGPGSGVGGAENSTGDIDVSPAGDASPPTGTGGLEALSAMSPVAAADTDPDSEVLSLRREFAALLGAFRRTAVLVPLGTEPDDDGRSGLLTSDLNGIRWIFAFSDEEALARFALARGEGDRAWPYQRILGARLLDVAVVAAGVPCGVALDAADGVDGVVFPPVRGIVPDAVAVDVDNGEGAAR